MSRLNVALVSPYDFACPGGVTEHVSQLDRSLRRLGHRTTVIAPVSSRYGFRPPENLTAMGRVVSVPTNGSIARITLSLGLSRRIKQILQHDHFDVVHLHEPFMPLLPFYVLHHSETANVATFHAYSGNELGYRRGRFLLRRFFGRLHARIAVSETARSFVNRHFPARYSVIPNGVDVDRFRTAAPDTTIADGTPTILFVGRLEERKGFRYLLRAYARIRRAGCRARLLVVGAYGVEQRRHYERLVAAANVPDVVFVGYVPPDQLPRYYKSADLVCAPSLGGESFGMVLVEAMAAGRPIIASRIAGYREVVDDGVDGLLVPPADSDALADALVRLLADRELRHDLGNGGQGKASRYDWARIAPNVLEIYDAAMIDSRGGRCGGIPRRVVERGGDVRSPTQAGA